MNILLGISGGIAAYKAPELIRLLKKAGHEVKVVVTDSALQFTTELTLETLSQNKVYSRLFDTGNDHTTEHVALADWGDLLLIAPATANTVAKMACGIADDALSTTCAAFSGSVFVAPAMNVNMYNHPAFQHNLQTLQSRGVHIIDAETGFLACGTEGKGRMASPERIADEVQRFVEQGQVLAGRCIVITAGPTYERIDPVRFIGNFSTGKMGFALAEACAGKGAEVTLISGPVQLKTTNSRIRRIDVESAEQMHRAVMEHIREADGAILCAAVADFKPSAQAPIKLKRKGDNLDLTLTPTQDIAAAVGRTKRSNQFLVGFALETNDEEHNALDKMRRKNFDFIVLNSLRDPGAGFGYDTNKITILKADGSSLTFPLKPKAEVAEDIVAEILRLLP